MGFSDSVSSLSDGMGLLERAPSHNHRGLITGIISTARRLRKGITSVTICAKAVDAKGDIRSQV